jgi:hypothetical protein
MMYLSTPNAALRARCSCLTRPNPLPQYRTSGLASDRLSKMVSGVYPGRTREQHPKNSTRCFQIAPFDLKMVALRNTAESTNETSWGTKYGESVCIAKALATAPVSQWSLRILVTILTRNFERNQSQVNGGETSHLPFEYAVVGGKGDQTTFDKLTQGCGERSPRLQQNRDPI